MVDFAEARHRMVERQLVQRGIGDGEVLAAARKVPRELFLPAELVEFAYDDGPLPIGEGQTISQPYIVALMVEAARLGGGDRVLEVGTGSGYAAAILGHVASEVHSVERHRTLAEDAGRRLAELVPDVRVHFGDGTLGWPEAAPYDAILVAAGGPEPPEALKQQLKVGGRLVMPVGEREGEQHLVRLTRTGPDTFAEDDLGAVLFVPLIGQQGWAEQLAQPRSRARSVPLASSALPAMIGRACEPFEDLDAPAFGDLFDRFAETRVVLLGEASHGTSEFYRARAAITRRLVERHGFNIVAVEADWPDAARFDRFVRRRPEPDSSEPAFRRFPTWMWRNQEVDVFLRWLRRHNDGRAPGEQAGFYGLDLYNLSASIEAVIAYLERVDPELARTARERYGCLQPWGAAPQSYGRMAKRKGMAPCEDAVVTMLRELNERRMRYAAQDGDAFLDAAGNARLVQGAERYYRAMYYGSAESWNIRDRHMFDTLCHVLEARGPASKAVVWAHNSHIGDARATDMGWSREELNIGQLCRERFGRDAALIGFGTHAGTVAAADDWDEPVRIKRVNPSRPDSYERLAHDSGVPRFLLDLRPGVHDGLRDELRTRRLERFIGVIYRPDTERWSHYVECELPDQFDALVWFDETRAVTPVAVEPQAGPDDTYPFGL